MLDAGRLHPRVGSVAAQMRFADRRDVLNSAGLELDRLGIAADRLVGTRVDDHGPRMPYEVFGATGGAAIFRREMLDQVGGFDESFFAFFEDADLAWRAHAHGWRALYAPEAVVYHHHSATAQHGSPAKLYLVGRNRVRTLAKNATAGMLLVNGPWMLAYDAAYVAFASVTGRTLAPLRGRVARAARVARLPAQRRAAPPPADGCAARSASAARCSATSATRSTSRSARRRVEHPGPHGRRAGGRAPRAEPPVDAHGARARLVPGLPRLGAHRGRDVRRSSSATRTCSPSTPRASCCPTGVAAAIVRGVAPQPRSPACASAATTRAAGAGCCPTCRTTSSTSTSTATSWSSAPRTPARPACHRARRRCTSATATRRCATSGCPRPSATGSAASRAPALRALRGRLRRWDRARGAAAGPLRRQLDRGRRPDQALLRARRGGRPPAGGGRRLPARRRARPDALPLGPSPRALQAPARGGGGVPRAARPAADDGGRGTAGRRAARAPAAQRGAARVDLARASSPSCSRARRVSSTSARRTSASRWSRRSPPARRCSPPTPAGARDIVRPERDGVLIADPPTRARSAPACASWRAQLGRRRAAPERPALLGGAFPRAPRRAAARPRRPLR